VTSTTWRGSLAARAAIGIDADPCKEKGDGFVWRRKEGMRPLDSEEDGITALWRNGYRERRRRMLRGEEVRKLVERRAG
jgi:hypothetical protein